MTHHEPLSGVGKTALGMAMIRAWESRRPDRLFDDPYARYFTEAAPGAFAAEESIAARERPAASVGAAFAAHAVLRTRFFDDFLLSGAGSGCRQVVLLAAGLDTRAYRLPWPEGTRVFELDLPGVLEFKDGVLTRAGAVPACERVVIPADLRGDWPARLTETGFDPGMPTAWLAEGLLLYLSAAEAERLLGDVGALSAPGSRLAFEHGPADRGTVLGRAAALPGMGQYAALWKGGLGDGAEDWLSRNGWHPQFHDGAGFAAACGRPAEEAPSGYLTAVRR